MKRGFTLIELLAVIVVLAIVALITTPIISKTIEKSKKGAAIESGNNLIHSAEIYFMTTSPRYGKIDVLDPNLNYNGKKPELGEVEITKEGKTRIYAYINGYCVTKEYETETYASKTSKDNCNWYGTDNYETQEGTIFTLNNQKVKNYLIYGNSVQDGTPTSDNPVEVKNTGDLITSSNCSSYGSDACNNVGKYVIQVKNTGKNLVNFNQLYSDTSKFTNNDGVITGSNRSFHEIKYKIPKEYIGKKLTLSGKLKMEGEVTAVFFLAYTGGNRVASNVIRTKDTFVDVKVTLNIESEDDYFCISYGSYSGTVYAKDLQLELGDSVTEYESYKEPITTNIYLDEPLRKVGDYTDYIDFENKKVVRNVGKYVLNGTENWNQYSNSNKYYVSDLLPTTYEENKTILSNRFIGRISGDSVYTFPDRSYYYADGDIWLQSTSSYPRLYIYKNDITSVADFKTWLSSNNTTVLYPLATPTETTVNLPNIETLDGNTILLVNSDTQPSNIKLTTTK